MWRSGLFTLLFVSVLFSANAQGVHPTVQAMIDDLNTWMTTEAEKSGTIDPLVLELKSKRIREVQDSIAGAEKATLAVPPDPSSDVLESRKITRTIMAGSALVVPEKTSWKLTGVYVKNDMDGYRIQVSSIKFKDSYSAGEKIVAPTISSESALLSGESMSANYDFDIIETRYK